MIVTAILLGLGFGGFFVLLPKITQRITGESSQPMAKGKKFGLVPPEPGRQKNLEFLNSKSEPRFRSFEAELKTMGIHLMRLETLRSNIRQDWLYKMGREYDDGRGIVTNAKAGQSKHNTGDAVDYWPVGLGFGPKDSAKAKEILTRARTIAGKHGLAYYATWDYPHFHRKGA